MMLSQIEGIRSLTLASDAVHRRLVETLLSVSDDSAHVDRAARVSNLIHAQGNEAREEVQSADGTRRRLSQLAGGGRFLGGNGRGVNPSSLLTLFQKGLVSVNLPLLAAAASGTTVEDKGESVSSSLYNLRKVQRSDVGASDGAPALAFEEAAAEVGRAIDDEQRSTNVESAFTSPCMRRHKHVICADREEEGAEGSHNQDDGNRQNAPLIDITEIIFWPSGAAGGSLESIRLSHNVTTTWAVDVPQWAAGLFPTRSGRSQQTHQHHRDKNTNDEEHQQYKEHSSSSPHPQKWPYLPRGRATHSLSLKLLGAFMLDSLSPFHRHQEAFVPQSYSPFLPSSPQPAPSLFSSLVSPPMNPHSCFISTIVELDVTFNNILKSFPRGLQKLRKVFFEYCESLEDLDGLADGQVEDCFVGACQNFVVFPRGLSKLQKLELNWCTYTADLCALSFPAAATPRRSSCSSDPQQGKRGEESDGDRVVVTVSSDSHPRLRQLIINHNYRLTSLPSRLLSLVSIRLDKCEGLRSAASLSCLPLLESITIACCTALSELPNWWWPTAMGGRTLLRQSNSDDKLINVGENGKDESEASEINESDETNRGNGYASCCSVKKVIINETAVEDVSLASMLLSCRNSLEDVDISFNQRLCRLEFSTNMQVEIGHLFSASCDRLETLIFPKLHTLTVISCSGLESLGLFFDDLAIEEKALSDAKVQRTEDDVPPLSPTVPHHSMQHWKQKQEQRQVSAPSCRLPSLQTLNLVDLEALESISLTRVRTSLNSLHNNNYNYDNRDRPNLSCVSSSYSKFPLLTTLSLAWCVCLPPQTLALLLSGGHCPNIQRLDATGCYNFTDFVIYGSEGGSGCGENVAQQQQQATANAKATADSGRVSRREELDNTLHMTRFPTQHKLEKLVLEGCSSLVLAINTDIITTTKIHAHMPPEEDDQKGHVGMSAMHGDDDAASRRHQFSRGDEEKGSEETDVLLDDEDDEFPLLILTHTNFPLLKELNVAGCRLNRGASAHHYHYYHQKRYCPNDTSAELACGPPIITAELERRLTRLIT